MVRFQVRRLHVKEHFREISGVEGSISFYFCVSSVIAGVAGRVLQIFLSGGGGGEVRSIIVNR